MSTHARVGVDITATDRSGPAFQSALRNLKTIETQAGQTTNRMRNMSFQVGDVFSQIASGANPLMVVAQQGPQIAQIYGFGQGGVAQAFRDVGNMMLFAVQRAGPLAAIGGALATGLTREVNRVSGETYTMGEVFAAAFDVIREGAANTASPALNSLSSVAAQVGDSIFAKFKTVQNALIGGWVAFYNAGKTLLMALPDIVVLAGQSMVNSFLGSVELMVNGGIGAVNRMAEGLNSLFDKLPDELRPDRLGLMKEIKLPKFDTSESTKSIFDAFDGLGTQIGKDFSRDYLGEFFKAVGDQAGANRLASIAKTKGMQGRVAMPKPARFAGGDDEGGSRFNEFNHPLYGGDWNKLRGEMAATAEAMQPVKDAASDIRQMFQGWFDSSLQGGFKLKNVLSDLQNLVRGFASRGFSALLSGIFSGMGGGGHPLYGAGGGGGFLSSLFSGLPSFAVGTPRVPHDMVARIHKDEMIVPAREADGLRRGGGGGVTQVFNISAAGADRAAIAELKRALVDMQKNMPRMAVGAIARERGLNPGFS